MGETSIEWTDATWNPIRGCSIVSEGCRNCYAMRQAHRQKSGAYKGLTRLGSHGPTWTGDVRFVPEFLDYPLRLRKPHMIFVNSMSDLFHPGVQDEWIDQVFAVMRRARRHIFQVLTKRPERMLAYLTTATLNGKTAESRVRELAPANTAQHWYHATNWRWPLPNVWLGTSVEDQESADKRIQLLLATPAAVRWVSAEPMLGPLDLNVYLSLENRGGLRSDSGSLDWLVVGGESGPGARPMHPEWARSLQAQCSRNAVPFFFKQWGAWYPYGSHPPGTAGRFAMISNHERGMPVHHEVGHYPRPFTSFGSCVFEWKGKKDSGRLLDGREWREFPDVSRGDS